MDRVLVRGFDRNNNGYQLPRNKCNCITTEDKAAECFMEFASIPRPLGTRNVMVYNTTTLKSEPMNFAVKKDDKDCKCNPPPLEPPCSTLDCQCIQHDIEAFSRRRHKSFCPSYKHKETCPVTRKGEEEGLEAVEEEVEHLPYGLPPITVGPCPVPGKPCSGTEGRINKSSAPTPQQPPTNIGKISCSKEFERIKRAMLDFMEEQEKPPFPCINKFNVDTERRCCDDDQRLLGLIGKTCCATHKLAALALFKEAAETEASEKRNASAS